jgi:hypothetical protein
MKNRKKMASNFLKAGSILLMALALFMGCGGGSGDTTGGGPQTQPPPPTFSITGVTVAPNVITIEKGKTYSGFTATVAGTGDFTQDVIWSVASSSVKAGTRFEGGVLSIDAAETVNNFQVRATSADDPTKSGTANVIAAAVGAGPTVTAVNITPAAIQLAKGSTRTFTAAVVGTNNPAQGVTWSIITTPVAEGTTLSPAGLLTIAAAETNTSITIRAVSFQDNTKSGQAVITVIEQGGAVPTVTAVNITPATGAASVARGGTLQFAAEVVGTNNPSPDVLWSIRTTGLRNSTTLSTGGLLSVAQSEKAATPSITIRAASVEDPTKFSDVAVTLTGDFYHPNVRSGESSGVIEGPIPGGGFTWQLMHWLPPLEAGDYTLTLYQKGASFKPIVYDDGGAGEITSTDPDAGSIGGVGSFPAVADWTLRTIRFTRSAPADHLILIIADYSTDGKVYVDDASLTKDGGDDTNLLADPGFESGAFAYNNSADDKTAEKGTASIGWYGIGKSYVYFYTITD